MELKPGYKLTEVGVIPEDWDVTTIGKVANIIDPQPDHRTPPETSLGEPYIGISDFINDISVDWDNCRRVISKAVDKQQKSFQVSFGDIIFGKIGTIGFPKFLPKTSFRYALSANVILLQPKRIAPYFLMGWLKSNLGQQQINKDLHSTSQAAFGILKMRDLLIVLPPSFEQKEIATALSDMDALLIGLDQLIAKKRDLKQAAMQQLLMGKKRLPGFGEGKGYQQTDVGIIPEDWNVGSLGDIFRLENGFSFKSEYFSSVGPIVLTPGNFKLEGGLYFNDRNTKRYSGRFPESTVFKNGDLLVVMTDLTPDCNLLGKPAFVNSEEKILHNQRIGKIRLLSDNFDKQFLYFVLLSAPYLKQIKDQATGSTVRHTSNKSIYSVSLPIPRQLEEQRAIAKALSDMDAEIAALEQRRDKTRALKQGMMQELLTGRTRLV